MNADDRAAMRVMHDVERNEVNDGERHCNRSEATVMRGIPNPLGPTENSETKFAGNLYM